MSKTTFADYGIKVSVNARGDVKTICPNCTPGNRKPEHRNNKDLSVNIEKGVWNCHNCGWVGSLQQERKVKEWTKPLPRLETVSKETIRYFEKRGISNNTIIRFGITEAKEWMPLHEQEVHTVCFNYFRNEQLVNIKFRAAKKAFKMVKDAELIFYNLDAIKDGKTAVIVEGEIDCLSLYECGFYNVVSVPNGASKGNQKLEYLDNCWQYFEAKDKIILAVDNDEAGNMLKEELARRLGKERCYIVSYPEGCKDSNDVLVKHGVSVLKEVVDTAVMYPMEGMITLDDMYGEICQFYEKGYPRGSKARIQGFDELLSFSGGQMTTITGIPGSGKDEFLNWIMANLAKYENWSWGVCGFEEPPAIQTTKILEKLVGKAFDFRTDFTHRMNVPEFEEGIAFIDRYFNFMHMDEMEATLDAVLAKGEELVRRKGIKGLTLNPWNCFEHKYQKGQNESSYTSEALTKILSFAKRTDTHVFLVAHPTKMTKNPKTHKYEIPTLYNISGSAHFFNKTTNGMSIYRDFTTNEVTVYMQKCKFSWLGRLGSCSFRYNTFTRQYEPIIL